MSYQDRFGHTKINDSLTENLAIHWGYQDDEKDLSQREVILFYTPHMNYTKTHYHIPITREGAKKLRDWLNDFLEDVEGTEDKARYFIKPYPENWTGPHHDGDEQTK